MSFLSTIVLHDAEMTCPFSGFFFSSRIFHGVNSQRFKKTPVFFPPGDLLGLFCVPCRNTPTVRLVSVPLTRILHESSIAPNSSPISDDPTPALERIQKSYSKYSRQLL